MLTGGDKAALTAVVEWGCIKSTHFFIILMPAYHKRAIPFRKPLFLPLRFQKIVNIVHNIPSSQASHKSPPHVRWAKIEFPKCILVIELYGGPR